MKAAKLSHALYARARQVIPGGVNSPVRAWQAVGGEPIFVQRGRGSHIWDADGREYIDYVCSWGPLVLGHAHPEVLRALQEAARDGTSFGAPTAREVEIAELLCQAVPSLEMVRLTSSGTEACMTALRLARAKTGRDLILKFEGCYHGHSDGLLVRAGSGAATLGIPDSAGVPPAVAGCTLVAPFNDTDAVRDAFARNPGRIAAVIVEPVVGNSGVILPRPGFLQALRETCSAEGALLIFDEVITGFRLSWGGAQSLFEVVPDLTCLGKIVGGGLPLAAIGGRREVMELLAPTGPVYQAGTLSGNPLAVAAGLATLRLLQKPGVYERLDELTVALTDGIGRTLRQKGIRHCINRLGSMWTVFFGVEEVTSAADAARCDREQFRQWFRGMLEEGVYLPPSPFEAAFVSFAHTEADVERTLDAAGKAVDQIG
jgi:glutamate-1-semialdehyde 2,1-aminomutase